MTLFSKKARSWLIIFLTFLVVPFIIIIRALSPIVVIRFGKLISERLGHFAANTEIYLCKRDTGMLGRWTFDLFYHIEPISNHQLKKMWSRTLHVSRLGSFMYRANKWLPGAKKHLIPLRVDEDRDIHGILAQTRPHLSFTTDEEKLGYKSLRHIGIPEGTPFVCLHVRDSAYLDTTIPYNQWDYHDYRDSQIDNHISAAIELANRGYYIIRMGAFVKDELKCKNQNIIDYAIKWRTEFLDIFLGAKCRFCLCSPSGFGSIPMIFRRPIAWVNVIPLEHTPTWSQQDLCIPKKLWLKKEGRFLTFPEILDSDIGRFLWSEQYDQAGIEVIENTPEEITTVAVEMDERLKGTWKTTEEDEELQRRFWALFKPSELNQVFLSRIGADFLRQNKELLE